MRFQPKIDQIALAEAMRQTSTGHTLPWSVINEAAKADCRATNRGSLYRLRERMIRDEQIVFRVVSDGLLRLDDTGKIDAGGAKLFKARRAARRCIQTTMAVENYDGLPDYLKARHTAQVAIGSAVAAVLTTKMIRQVEKVVGTLPTIDVAATLDAFKRGVVR